MTVLSTDARIPLAALLGQPASLKICLADGSRTCFDGDISAVAMVSSNGGLARYRLHMSPWMWRPGQVRNSRVWQDKTVIEIDEQVFEAYSPAAKWRWSDEAGPFMDGAAFVDRRRPVLRSISASLTTVLSCHYKSKQAVGASVPSRLHNGSMIPELESFDVPGQYAYSNSAQAKRYARIQMQGKEARAHLWRGRSTLRTLRAGTRLTIIGAPLRQLGDSPAFAVLRVASVGE